METKNVILISLLPPPYGGIAQWTKKVLSIGPNYGINYRFVNESARKDRKHFGDRTKRNIFSDFKRALTIRKQLKKVLKETDKSYVVHCCIPSLKFSMLREYWNLKLIKKYKRKYILHLRSTVSQNVESKSSLKILKKILKKSDKVILLNQKSLEFCGQFCEKSKLCIIPNFLDKEELKEKKNHRDNIQQVLYVGMGTLEKGVDDILEVSKRFPSITFNIVGRISEEVKTICEKGSFPNVVFAGALPKDEISSYYENADLFLFLSRFKSEGFSNALCEAMGNGLPCIVTDWAANEEMVKNSDYDCIVKPHDIDNLEEKIKLFNNKLIRESVSKFNFEKVVSNYTEQIIMNQLRETYIKTNG